MKLVKFIACYIFSKSSIDHELFIDQDLSYGEILAGPPGAWLVKQIFFCMHAIKKVKKGTYIEIQNDFQNMFEFYDSLYGL